MKFYVGLLAAALIAVPAFAAQDTVTDRLHAATQDLHEMMNASDKGIPQDLFSRAQCVVVIPDLKKAGFVVGGEYGAGFFTCRKPSGVGWSAPGSVKITGGKFGFLIGGAETDVIMLVMSKSGMEHMLSDKFKMGGEASAAAGPIGRDASAMTDAELHAEILTYSRQRGLYGGLNLAGSAVTEDDDANKQLYGRDLSNKQIVTGDVHTPPEARAFIHELDRVSSRK
jgi:SH3 domain-containing YSC84-like protein 1